MDECDYAGLLATSDTAAAAPGSVVSSPSADCRDLTVPALPCGGRWGVLPGLPETLVVLDSRSNVFGDALRVPDFDEPPRIVCVRTPFDRSVAEYLMPCGDARIPGEEHLMTVAQRILRTTTEWYASADSPLRIGADATFFGGCTPPTDLSGDPSIELTSISIKEDVEPAGDRIVDYRGTWQDLLPLVERIDTLATMLEEPPTFANDTCLAVNEFLNAFDHAVSNARVTHQFSMPWLHEHGDYTGSDNRYSARLGTSERDARELLDASSELGEALIDDFGTGDVDAWMAASIDTLNTLTDEPWKQLLAGRFAAQDASEIFEDLEAASGNPHMVRQFEVLGLIAQVHEQAICVGTPAPRTDWINPEFVFGPRLDEYDPMGSSELQAFTVEPTTSDCEANVVLSDLNQRVNLAAGRDMFGFAGAGRLNATAVSVADGTASALTDAMVEAARSCPPDDMFVYEVREVGGYPVIVTQDREDSAVIWVTHVARNNVSLRVAKWFTADDPVDDRESRFLVDVQRFHDALRNAPPEEEIFPSDLR